MACCGSRPADDKKIPGRWSAYEEDTLVQMGTFEQSGQGHQRETRVPGFGRWYLSGYTVRVPPCPSLSHSVPGRWTCPTS